jgi:hypothetical protein
LKVFDILGRQVAVVVDRVQDAGRYSAWFNARNLASGMYFYRLEAGSFTSTRKMLLAK